MGKDLEESLKGHSNLPGRRSVKTFHPVHSQEDPPPAGRLHHGAQLHESFHHLLLGGVVVGRIRLQEG